LPRLPRLEIVFASCHCSPHCSEWKRAHPPSTVPKPCPSPAAIVTQKRTAAEKKPHCH
jgi:hypothetical protein